jgi:hypothetical protein
MLKKGSAAAKAFMAKIRAAKGKKKTATKKNVVKKVGALPVGFEGKIFETTFKIINQFDIFNNVQSIVEDKKNGSTITVFDGKGNTADKAKQFSNYVENYAYPDSRLSEKDYKALYGKILKFSQNMQNEVKEYNKGNTKTIKKQPLNIAKPKKTKTVTKKVEKQTGLSNKKFDIKLQAKKPGKRTSKSGKTYYEYRENRSDKGKLLGINTVSMNSIGTELLIMERKIINLKERKKIAKTVKEKKELQNIITNLSSQYKSLKDYYNTRAKVIFENNTAKVIFN